MFAERWQQKLRWKPEKVVNDPRVTPEFMNPACVDSSPILQPNFFMCLQECNRGGWNHAAHLGVPGSVVCIRRSCCWAYHSLLLRPCHPARPHPTHHPLLRTYWEAVRVFISKSELLSSCKLWLFGLMIIFKL